MKALIYAEAGMAKLAESDKPVLSDNQVLIKVHAAGICGTDISIISGKHPRAKAGLVLGHEFAGEAVQINAGSGESDISVGDKVTAFPLLFCDKCWACTHGCQHVCKTLRMTGIDEDGGLAEFVKIPLELTCKLPDEMDYEAAALIEPIAVGIHAVDMGNVNPGDKVVVMGAGPIGLIVALSLKRAGVKNIIITDVQPFRLNLANEFGFETINCEQADVTEKIDKFTDGQGADVVLECAGSASAAIQMCRIVRSRGRIVLVSVHKDAHPTDLRSINFKEITVVGSRVYTRDNYDQAIKMINETAVTKLISHRVKLDDALEGIKLMQSGKDVCKVIVTME